MAGLSSRFFKAGYTVPKYMLDLGGYPVFDYALRSFMSRFSAEEFLIILRRDHNTEAFVRRRLAANSVSARLVVLDHETRGQAETVAIGLEAARVTPDVPITIFNIDSFRPDFSMTSEELSADGYIETFRGVGDAWSFVEPAEANADHGKAVRVLEKERISELCCTGLYYFRTRQLFEEAYAAELAKPSQRLKEHYISPIYNQMIIRGFKVLYRNIPNDEVIFCGVPDEYEMLLGDPNRIRQIKNGLAL
jgi:dTDP-glucose pyrophosphorylase